MQIGYSLCTTDKKKVLCIKKGSEKIELLDTADKKNIDNALCLQSLTSIKTIYDKFRDKKLVDELDIVDIQELYR
tara:strand:- start:6760 stop:6984 length:225 start_codon:yes stop_codon:yes gene_type:complete